MTERTSVAAWGHGRQGWITEEDKQTCGDDEHFYYFDCGDGFLGVHIFQNLPNRVYIHGVYCTLAITQKVAVEEYKELEPSYFTLLASSCKYHYLEAGVYILPVYIFTIQTHNIHKHCIVLFGVFIQIFNH